MRAKFNDLRSIVRKIKCDGKHFSAPENNYPTSSELPTAVSGEFTGAHFGMSIASTPSTYRVQVPKQNSYGPSDQSPSANALH